MRISGKPRDGINIVMMAVVQACCSVMVARQMMEEHMLQLHGVHARKQQDTAPSPHDSCQTHWPRKYNGIHCIDLLTTHFMAPWTHHPQGSAQNSEHRW